MGCIVGEWVFEAGEAPPLDSVVDALRARTGLAIDATHDDDGHLASAVIPLLKEILFDWDRQPDRIRVHSLLPGHPYVWTHLHGVMTGFGGEVSRDPIAWRPEGPATAIDRPWADLTGRQRFILRLPTIGKSRPLDFLAQREA